MLNLDDKVCCSTGKYPASVKSLSLMFNNHYKKSKQLVDFFSEDLRSFHKTRKQRKSFATWCWHRTQKQVRSKLQFQCSYIILNSKLKYIIKLPLLHTVSLSQVFDNHIWGIAALILEVFTPYYRCRPALFLISAKKVLLLFQLVHLSARETTILISTKLGERKCSTGQKRTWTYVN